MNEQALVAKVWNYAHALREHGLRSATTWGRPASSCPQDRVYAAKSDADITKELAAKELVEICHEQDT